MDLQSLLNSISGPRLYRWYRTADHPSRAYSPNTVESLSDNILRLCSITFKLAAYTSPLVVFYYYRKGTISFQSPYVNLSDFYSFTRVLLWLMAGYAFATFGRGLGRLYNPDYQQFMNLYSKMIKLPVDDFRKQKPALNAYDFDFDFWPIEYRWKNSSLADLKRPPEPLHTPGHSRALSFPLNLIGYLAIETFGKRMMYPGSVGLLQSMMEPVLREGRTNLVERHGGVRFKLQTLDNNYIDAMFINNRNKTPNGSKLVICCEGNAGFYEIGVANTPIAAGYSVLGWNHPGFGGSTGFPYPESEVNAADTVMKFAIDRLGFKQSNMIVFAWSIGGYSGSWLAMQYPEIRGLVLDATFDDVVELAVSKMPSSWSGLVVGAVRKYFDLNVSELLKYYHGPVSLIRRTKDEIINTNPEEPIRTNRANHILVNLFKTRFPKLMKNKQVEISLNGWLNQERKYYPYPIDPVAAFNSLKLYIQEKGKQYPIYIGDGLENDAKINLVLYLASKTMKDFNSTHCTNLPTDMFQEPWDILRQVASQNKL